MKYVETKAETVEKAIEKALLETGAKREDVRIEILNDNQNNAKVRVYLEYKEFEFIENFLNGILEIIKDKGKINFAFHPPRIHVNLSTRRSDKLLIGKNGETLKALEHLLYQAFRKRFKDLKVRLDISNYKKKKQAFIIHKAKAVAKLVRESKREISIDILSEEEERLVKKALKKEKGIKIYTAGKGKKKNIVIAPLT
ncbi:MAG: Jag N-terminal domain-containing protein [Candidatus Hydrothermales bacterium]